MIMQLLNQLIGRKDETELNEFLSAHSYLVDVRTEAEFRGGSIEGAVNIPLSDIKRKHEKLIGKTNIVVFCRSGIRSKAAVLALKEMGIKKVINGGSLQNLSKAIQKTKKVV